MVKTQEKEGKSKIKTRKKAEKIGEVKTEKVKTE